jgi:dTDP-4-amino-4,6-dideoxygalactose transaminase
MSRAFIPFGKQNIDDEDIASVNQVLRSAWLITGPRVGEFERAFAELPLFPTITDADIDYVVSTVSELRNLS